jgi:hypothetical protein
VAEQRPAQFGQQGLADLEAVGQEPAERSVTPVRLLERGAQVGGALLEDRPQQLGIGHDPRLDQVHAEFLVARAVEVVGQQVVAEHQFA